MSINKDVTYDQAITVLAGAVAGFNYNDVNPADMPQYVDTVNEISRAFNTSVPQILVDISDRIVPAINDYDKFQKKDQ